MKTLTDLTKQYVSLYSCKTYLKKNLLLYTKTLKKLKYMIKFLTEKLSFNLSNKL